jgi:8-oxo-dGTP diphosphatase/2-hydroxy-dATP diphosphatase
MDKLITTLVLVQKNDAVLLGMKKRGFGKGRWNGFGGKVDEGETIEEAAIRETQEESEIMVTHLDKFAIFTFSFEENPKEVLDVHMFRTHSYTGTPAETEEMKPQWFKADEIPFDTMWPDDSYWFPHFLNGEYITGHFHFGGPEDAVLDYKITLVDKNKLT